MHTEGHMALAKYQPIYDGLEEEQDKLQFVGDIKNVCLTSLNHILFAKEALLWFNAF